MRFKHLHTILCHHCRLRRLSLALVLGLVETALEASQVPTFQYLARLLLRHATRKTPCASLAAAYNSRSPAEPKLAFIQSWIPVVRFLKTLCLIRQFSLQSPRASDDEAWVYQHYPISPRQHKVQLTIIRIIFADNNRSRPIIRFALQFSFGELRYHVAVVVVTVPP